MIGRRYPAAPLLTRSAQYGFAAGSLGLPRNRHKAILPKRQAKFRVTGNLKGEVSVSTLKKKLVGGWPANRESAKHERSRGEAKCLGRGAPLFTNSTDALSLLQLLLINKKFAEVAGKNLPCMLQRAPRLPTKLPQTCKNPKSTQNWRQSAVFDAFGGCWPERPKVLKPNQLGVGCGGMI